MEYLNSSYLFYFVNANDSRERVQYHQLLRLNFMGGVGDCGK